MAAANQGLCLNDRAPEAQKPLHSMCLLHLGNLSQPDSHILFARQGNAEFTAMYPGVGDSHFPSVDNFNLLAFLGRFVKVPEAGAAEAVIVNLIAGAAGS